jgi:ketosteroid isomerase-like protein
MSDREQEMINGLRRAYDAFNRGDFDTAIELAHPEIEYVPPGGQALLKGANALRAWMEPDAFESQVLEIEELKVAGDRVLVRQRATARGAASGIEMEIQSWTLWTFDPDGKAIRAEVFLPHQDAEAFEAAGLSE